MQKRLEGNMRNRTETDDKDEHWKKRGNAITKVQADCARTAAKMLKGSGVLPPCEATASAQCAQLVSESSNQRKEELRRLVDQALAD